MTLVGNKLNGTNTLEIGIVYLDLNHPNLIIYKSFDGYKVWINNTYENIKNV